MRATTNSALSITWHITHKADGSDYDLTGLSLEVQFKNRRGSAAALTFKTSDSTLIVLGDPTGGLINAQATKAQMSALDPGNYAYDIVVITGADNASRLGIGGVLPVFSGVTEDASKNLPLDTSDTTGNEITVVVDENSTLNAEISLLQGFPGSVRPLAQLKSYYDSTTALSYLRDPNVVLIVVYRGQSLSNWHITTGQDQHAITTTVKHPGIVRCPVTDASNGLPARVPGEHTIIGLTDLYEYDVIEDGEVHAETGLSGCLNTFVEKVHDALGIWISVVGFSIGVSNQNFLELKKGSDAYENGLDRLKEVVDLIRLEEGKRPIIAPSFWKQGNSDTNFFTGAPKYTRDLHQDQRQFETDAMAITGQVERVPTIVMQDGVSFFTPMSTTNALTPDDLDIPAHAQLRAALENPMIILGGSEYDCDVTPKYHNPHYSSRGYLLSGTREGRVLTNAVCGLGWGAPHWIPDDTEYLSAYKLRLHFDVPLTKGAGLFTPDIQFGTLALNLTGAVVSLEGLYDSTSVGCGFALIDRQGNRVETNEIIDVQVYFPGGNVTKENVDITFARAQSANGFITYAAKQTPRNGLYGIITIVAGGNGGTDGTYDLIFGYAAGEPTFAPAAATFTVAGGTITEVDVTDFGFGINTLPTFHTSNCPGLQNAVLSGLITIVSCSGPGFGARGLLEAVTETLMTAAGDNAGIDRPVMQYQRIPPGPTPRRNLLRNVRGRVLTRATPSLVAVDGTRIHDGWKLLTNISGGKTVAATTYVDPKVGSLIRVTNDHGGAGCKVALVQTVPYSEIAQLQGQPVTTCFRTRRTNAASLNRSRLLLLAWSGTRDQPPADVVNDWTSTDLTTPGAFFINDANLAIFPNVIVDSQNKIKSPDQNSIAVPSNANNLLWFAFTYASMIVGESFDIIPWLEHGITQTGIQSIDDQTEIESARRYYGTMQVWVHAGQSQWINRPTYNNGTTITAPTVTVTTTLYGATAAHATSDGFWITGGTQDELVTVTWDTGL